MLRVHDGAVNAVAAAGSGRFLTGGEDGRIALWQMGAPEPIMVFADHQGPVAGLALSPDGAMLASASWDGTVACPAAGRRGGAYARAGIPATSMRWLISPTAA